MIAQRLFKTILGLMLLFAVSACNKEDAIGKNPYEGGKEPFGIVFTAADLAIESGLPGEKRVFQVKGLKKYENDFQFYINDVESEVLSLTDSTIEVLIPQQVSSGVLSVKYNNQVFFGPIFRIDGKVSVDVDFGGINGFNGIVNTILPEAGGFMIGGVFTNYENEATLGVYRNSIHFINNLGKSATAFNFGRGAAFSYIYSMVKLSGGKFMVAGSITAYNKRSTYNLARLNANGTLDSMVVDVINPTPEFPLKAIDTVSAFNGGSSSSITKIFPTTDDGIIAIGNFSTHLKIDYRYSSRENRRFDFSRVSNVMKLKADGSLDSAYSHQNLGASGFVFDGAQLADGKILLVGSFKTFNGVASNNMVVLNADGSVDKGFTIGSGPTDEVTAVSYNPNTQKIIVSGRFASFNGHPSRGLVILNLDGSVDRGFTMGTVGEGVPIFAQQLNNGKILVNGFFETYNGVRRSQVLILEPSGEAKQEYNNFGSFSGIVTSMVETTSSLGQPAILIGGVFGNVDGEEVGSIVRLQIRN